MNDGTALNVVPLRRADNIPDMLRSLADNIETGAVNAQEVMCIVREGVHAIRLYGWGDYRGNIAALGLLEAAKRSVDIETDDGCAD